MANPYSSDPHTTWELAKVTALALRMQRAIDRGEHREARRLEKRIDLIGEQAAAREARKEARRG